MSQFQHDPSKGMNEDDKDRFHTLNGPMFRKTPKQIEEWVETNVTDFDSAKALLKQMCKLQSALVKEVRELRAKVQ